MPNATAGTFSRPSEFVPTAHVRPSSGENRRNDVARDPHTPAPFDPHDKRLLALVRHTESQYLRGRKPIEDMQVLFEHMSEDRLRAFIRNTEVLDLHSLAKEVRDRRFPDAQDTASDIQLEEKEEVPYVPF